MKKILSLLLLASMLLPLTLVASAATVPTITVGTGTGAPGDEVCVDVTLSNNPGINTCTLNLDYDKTKLTFKDVTVSADVGGQIMPGADSFVWLASGDVSTSGKFFTVTFTVNENAAEGDVRISASYKKGNICNFNEDDVDFEVVPGKITVGEGGDVPPTPPTPTGDRVISVSNASAKKGETVTLNVAFLDNPGINTYTLSLIYDKTRLTFVEAAVPETVGGQFVPGTDKFVWLASNDVTVSGTFLQLTFKVNDNAPLGDAAVSVSYKKGDICNFDEDDVDFEILPGKVTVTAEPQFRRGDVNGDGKVNASDAILAKKILVGKEEWSKRADINNDNKVNASDIALLKRIIVGKEV